MTDHSSNLAGMTVNERLYERGLTDEFDKAFKGRDRSKLLQIYRLLDVDAEDAIRSVDIMLASPEKYGPQP